MEGRRAEKGGSNGKIFVNDYFFSYQRSTVQCTEYGSVQFHPLLSNAHHDLVKHLLLVLICSVCMVVVRDLVATAYSKATWAKI